MEGKISKTLFDYDRMFERKQRDSAKIHLNTLSPFNGFGGGQYWMTAVKQMTSKGDFLGMDFNDRNCVTDLYEDCKAKKLVQECGCVPWEMPGFEVRNLSTTYNILSQDHKKCDTIGRDCIEEKSNATFNCQTPCQGVYADISHWYGGETIRSLENMVQPLLTEYKNFKQKKVKKGGYFSW